MDVARLDRHDHALLCARFAQHGNSQRRMRAALEEAAARESLARLKALRAMEHALGVDLGAVCWRWEHRADAGTHPLEHGVMEYIAEARETPRGWELWVYLDRVHQLRELMEGRLVGERE